MRFCKNCGAALDDDGTQKAIPEKPVADPSKRDGRIRQYLIIVAVCVVLLVAGLGYLFSQTSLSVRSEPSGAGVYLDSEFRGVTPGEIHYLLPGAHQLEFRHDGYPTWLKSVTVTPGQAAAIDADLADNLIPEIKVACFSDETIPATAGSTSCVYQKGEAVALAGTAIRPHPKENPSVTISVYAQGTASPLITRKTAILPDNTYNLTLDGNAVPGGNYEFVASLPSGQKSTVAVTIESQEDTNIRVLRQIVEDYHKIHSYNLDDYFICADMAQDVWNIVDTRGMRALLVAGNIKNPAAGWKEYNHSWVIVETAPRQWVALETTGGFLVYKNNNPNYYRGIFFENPRELKNNMDLRRDYNNGIVRYETMVNQYTAKKSEYNTEQNYYRSLADSYNNDYAGKDLTPAEYNESVKIKNSLDSEEMKLVRVKAEMDQLSVTCDAEKQILDNMNDQMGELVKTSAVLMNS
jgi:hypothetical protein